MVGGATRFARELQGYRVTSQREEGNEVRLSIELTNQNGKVEPHTLRMVREDNQWFPVMHIWLAGPESVEAAMDVPSKFQQRK